MDLHEIEEEAEAFVETREDLLELVLVGLGLPEALRAGLIGAAGELVLALAALPDGGGHAVELPRQALGAAVRVELDALDVGDAPADAGPVPSAEAPGPVLLIASLGHLGALTRSSGGP